jgi:rhamnosyltransferase subunit B
VTPLHVILTSIGTDGDVFPYAALGAALVRRGHRATLVAGEHYRPLAEANGLGFRPLLSREENEQCFGDPDFWHPLKGPVVAARWGVGFLPQQYELFAELARDGRAVFVASPGLVAARVVQDKLGVPLASVVLQPWMIQSSAAPPVMPGGLTLPRWAPRPAAALYWLAFDAVGGLLLLGKPLNALRARLGLPPVRRVFRWWLSPQLVLGLFPAWYGPPQPDWRPGIRLTGFPMYDGMAPDMPGAPNAPGVPDAQGSPNVPGAGRAGGGLSDDLQSFLDAGEPPVAFTFGTGMRHAAALFRVAADACRALGVRGLFLTRFADQLPPGLPPGVRHVSFAPFQHLFPRCAVVVVHHGGIGTVAKALAAGVPQLVLPVAFDQTDNAIRVKRLGAGEWMMARTANAARMASALRGLLTAERGDAASAVARRFTATDSLEIAASHVEELGAP